MRSLPVRLIALFLIVVIGYVLISPAFDLDPTANRAWKAARQLMVGMALNAALVSGSMRLPIELLAVLAVLFFFSAPSLESLCVNLN